MPDIQAGVSLPWTETGVGAVIQAGATLSWTETGAGSIIQSSGSDYAIPAAPPNAPPVVPGDQTPGATIPAGRAYVQTNTLAVIDLRDNAPLPVESVSMNLSDGAAFWTLSARGFPTLFAKLTSGEQPATVRVTLNGLVWEFIVESVDATRQFADSPVTFGGRSSAAVCDGPYQFKREWIANAPTTAAQICAAAQAFTNVEIVWNLEDWLVPGGAWSFQGTPFEVVRQVAAAVSATVEAHRSELKLRVYPRYLSLPNEWASTAPDVQIAWDATESESYVRDDRPHYDGVFLAGQQQGALALVRLAGASGANQAPMITDPLLTDLPALVQRGMVELASAGGKARVTRALQVLTGAGRPGVIERGAKIRCVDPTETWNGIVRSVSVTATLGYARQTIEIERQTSFVLGSVAPVPIPPPPPVVPVHTVIQITFAGMAQYFAFFGPWGDDRYWPEYPANFYNGGAGSTGSTGGVNYQITFSANAVVLRDADDTGVGNFANEPHPPNVLGMESGTTMTMNVPLGIIAGGVSCKYSAANASSMKVYSEINGGGTLLGTVSMPAQHTGGAAVGDPFGVFANWSLVGLATSAPGKSIVFTGVANNLAIGEINFAMLL